MYCVCVCRCTGCNQNDRKNNLEERLHTRSALLCVSVRVVWSLTTLCSLHSLGIRHWEQFLTFCSLSFLLAHRSKTHFSFNFLPHFSLIIASHHKSAALEWSFFPIGQKAFCRCHCSHWLNSGGSGLRSFSDGNWHFRLMYTANGPSSWMRVSWRYFLSFHFFFHQVQSAFMLCPTNRLIDFCFSLLFFHSVRFLLSCNHFWSIGRHRIYFLS